MVQRWKAKAELRWLEQEEGDIVAYSDYLALCEALKEALEGWLNREGMIIDEWGKDEPTEVQNRIAELKKQFLDI